MNYRIKHGQYLHSPLYHLLWLALWQCLLPVLIKVSGSIPDYPITNNKELVPGVLRYNVCFIQQGVFIYFAFVFCFFIGQRPDNYRSDTQENHHAQFCDHSHRHRGANLGHTTGKPRRVSASALTSELH